MNHDRVVVVGVDGSAPSHHALDWAALEARALGWSLELQCCYSLPSFAAATLDGGYAAVDEDAIHEGAQAVVDEALARIAKVGIPVTSQLASGDAAAALVERSKTAGLMVVGTRGSGGFADRLLGSVSATLPAHSHCPTVVVPLRTAVHGGESKNASADLVAVKEVCRIVVGVDGSPASEVALARAVSEAVAWKAQLTVVTGVPVAAGAGILAWLPADADHESIMADVSAGLDVVVDQAVEDHPDLAVSKVVLDGTGAELLTEFSSAVDLVVVGSRGRGGFAGLLLGSTSQAVLHHAVCPVMIVTKRVRDEGVPPVTVDGEAQA